MLGKLDQRAVERYELHRLAYHQFFAANYRPEHVVFVDERSSDRRTMYRGQGYAIAGERAFQKAFRVRGVQLAA